MSDYPRNPEDLLTPEELAGFGQDRPAAASLIMGRLVPFNTFMGIEIVEVTKDRALLKLPYREELIGDPARPALHGGALSMLADTAGGTAAIVATEHGDKVSTLDMRIDYLRGGLLQDTFAEALVVRAGSRAVVVRIHVYQDDVAEPDARRHVADSTAVYSVFRNTSP